MEHKILGIGDYVPDDFFNMIETFLKEKISNQMNIGDKKSIVLDNKYYPSVDFESCGTKKHSGNWELEKTDYIDDWDLSIYKAKLIT